MRRLFRNSRLAVLLSAACLGLAGIGALLVAGCESNDPFDPDSAPNAKPTVQLFAAPVDPANALSPTSYNARTFYWSGNDRDGWIVDYYVSIRTDYAVEAPWDTTQNTDTTMTFATDVNGEAEATFYLACRDNRGALSDTLVRTIPLQNFPPVINFEPDFDPRFDLQREITAENDTLYWNWGVNNFRFFAFDPDGSLTMDSSYRYTLSDVEPLVTRDVDDILANPATEWVRVPFENEFADIHHFELFFPDVAPGDSRRLTISLADEAAADTRFVHEWSVREPKGQPGSRVLWVQEGAGVPAVFQTALDRTYGVDGWDVYRFWAQFPDHPMTLIETFRKFDLVIWGNSGGASPNLEDASAKSTKILQRYSSGLSIDGVPEAAPGRLFMFSPSIAGYSCTIDPAFLVNTLGIYALSGGTVTLEIAADKQALGLAPHLLPMISQTVYGGLKGVSLDVQVGVAEPLYQMELCPGCYGGGRQGPAQPIVGARRPLRAVSETASVVVLGFTPEYFSDKENIETDPTVDALRVILEQELGVTAK